MNGSRPPNPTDAQLVARAIEGDREAFGDLYERHLAAIYRYIYYRVGEPHEAEDLTEVVFLRAWEALGRYRSGDAPLMVWLYRIAHNLLIDRYRTAKELVPLEEHHPDGALHHQPERVMEVREEHHRLAKALQQLDPAQQQVLTLRFIAELSHAETATIMGRSEGAVRVLQHRALAALRTMLNGKLAKHEL
jgi:RNA polymerase sigma-70 factor (ECF subfamily)